MDPLSIAGSIAGLVTLADAVFRSASRYRKAVKGAHKEINELMAEVKNLSLLLHNLSLLASDLEASTAPENHAALHFQPHYLHECQQVLRRLEKELPIAEQSFVSSSSGERLHARLKWPFSSPQLKETIESLRKHQQLVNVALAAESISRLMETLSHQKQAANDVRELQAVTKEILDIQTQARLDKKRRDMIDFFLQANPQPEFEMSKRLRHPLTGLWLTQGESFGNWYSGSNAKLWLTGIPGSGKSVLAGAIITECLQRIQLDAGGPDPTRAVTYFYCTYRNPRTLTPAAILSCIAVQLARQSEEACIVLESYYEELRVAHSLPRDPTLDGLTAMIKQMFKIFRQVYIVVDGLDECGDHTDASVKALRSLAQERNHGLQTEVNMALLSREEMTIRERLEVQFDWLEIEAHTEDLQLYVAAELEERIASRRLRIRDITLKDHILVQLVNGAKGMFRWVACQLDHLCELPTDRARRDALATLPPTLTETYERILERIEGYNETIRSLVQHSLLLISSSDTRLTSRMICEATSASSTLYNQLDEDEVLEEEEIFRWCSSLIRKSSGGDRIEFAHFSVREFLEHTCTRHPRYDRYSVTAEKLDAHLGALCIRYVNFENFGSPVPEATEAGIQHVLERVESRPFYEYATLQGLQFLHKTSGEDDEHISASLRNLFEASSRDRFCAWTLEVIRHCLVGLYGSDIFFGPRRDFGGPSNRVALACIEAILSPEFTPLHMAAALALPGLCGHLIRAGAGVNVRSMFGTPLQCAVGGLTVFCDADNARYAPQISLVIDKSHDARRATVRLLLEASATADDVQLSSPFRTVSLVRLSLENLGHEYDPFITADLIDAGAAIEEEDVTTFKGFCDSILDDLQYERRSLKDRQVVPKMISALQRRIDKSEKELPHTLRFLSIARVLDIGWTESTAVVSEEDMCNFLLVVIRSNNGPELERFIEGDTSGAVHTLIVDADLGLTALQLAVWHQALDALEILLKAGCDPNAATTRGRTPIEMACEYDWDLMFSLLVKHGALTSVRNDEDETIWHICARSDSADVLALLLISDSPDDLREAMEQVSRTGDTPICLGLANMSRNSVTALLTHCTTKAAWRSSSQSIYRDAARLGSSAVLEKMLAVGVEVDGLDDMIGSPLHFVGVHADAQCVAILKGLFDIHQRPERHGRSPFESFVLSAVDRRQLMTRNVALDLLLPHESILAENEVVGIWHFMMHTAMYEAAFSTMGSWTDWSWMSEIFAHLLKLGFARIYEASQGQPAISPLSVRFSDLIDRTEEFSAINRRRTQEATKGDNLSSPVRARHWELVSEVVRSILSETPILSDRLEDPSVLCLLRECVIHDDNRLLLMLLDAGANIHSKLKGLSAFEVACFPYVGISDANFALLLRHAKTEHVQAENLHFHGGGPLHLAGMGLNPILTLWRLQILLQLPSLDVDRPKSAVLGTPLFWHTQRNSIATARLLLESGADPWLPCTPYAENAAIMAIAAPNGGPLIEAIAKVTEQKGQSGRWKKAIPLRVSGEHRCQGTILHLAAMFGRVSSIEFLLDSGYLDDLDPKDTQGRTPMHFAAQVSSPQTMQLLLQRGADINAKSMSGLTPLHLAAWKNTPSCVETLLKLGAKQLPDAKGCTPWIYGCGNPEVAQLLRANEKDKGEREKEKEKEKETEYGSSPGPSTSNPSALRPMTNLVGLRMLANMLLQAIQISNLDWCRSLLASGCPIDVEIDVKGQRATPLMLAVAQPASVEVVTWLIDNGASLAVVYDPPYRGTCSTVVEAAVVHSSLISVVPLMLNKLLEQEGVAGIFSPLHNVLCRSMEGDAEAFNVVMEVLEGHVKGRDVISKLIDKPDMFDNRETMPLHMAATRGLHQAALRLIRNSADVDNINSNGLTPLHLAAYYGDTKMATSLLDAGASPGACDYLDREPLWHACDRGHTDMIRLLTDDASWWETKSAGDVVKSGVLLPLLHSGVNFYGTRLFDVVFHGKQADWFASDVLGVCPAHLLLTGHPTLFTWLLSSGGGLERLCRSSCRRPLEWPDAAVAGLPYLSQFVKRVKFLRRLLSRDEVESILNLNVDGQHNVLCEAVRYGMWPCAEALLDNGADLEHVCGTHGTAFQAASSKQHLDTAKSLVRRGAQVNLRHPVRVKSDQNAAGASRVSKVTRWILVERYTEQAKISHMAAHEDAQVKGWSGTVTVTVYIKWEWQKGLAESMSEYAVRWQGILSGLRGTVVSPVDQ